MSGLNDSSCITGNNRTGDEGGGIFNDLGGMVT
jgi:hypothetical protein